MANERKTNEARFPSTHWSNIGRAGIPDEEQGQQALGELLMTYKPALVAYALGRFPVMPDQAADLFQSFVLDAVLVRGLIRRARRMKGYQFRSYLLTAWHNHIQGEFRKQRFQKRHPQGGTVSLEELTEVPEGMDPPPAPETFDVEWAKGVITQAALRMQDTCLENGKKHVWAIFEQRVFKPICEGVPPTPYAELVSTLHVDTPMQARNLLVAGKQLFTRCLRETIQQYAYGEAAVETELRELYLILEKAP